MSKMASNLLGLGFKASNRFCGRLGTTGLPLSFEGLKARPPLLIVPVITFFLVSVVPFPNDNFCCYSLLGGRIKNKGLLNSCELPPTVHTTRFQSPSSRRNGFLFFHRKIKEKKEYVSKDNFLKISKCFCGFTVWSVSFSVYKSFFQGAGVRVLT